jgi:hypothetical protein
VVPRQHLAPLHHQEAEVRACRPDRFEQKADSGLVHKQQEEKVSTNTHSGKQEE